MLKVNIKSLAISGSNLVFMLLFPGFFFYQSAIGLGFIPPLLGGYFGIVSLVTFPLTLTAFLYSKGKYKSNYTIIDAVFFSIVVLTVFVTFVNYVIDKPTLYSRDMFAWSMSGLLFNLECYFLARTIALDSRTFNYLIILSLGVMVPIVLYHIGEYGIYNLRQESEDSESLATYQGFARSLAIVGIFSMTTLHSSKLSFIVFLVTLIGLFFNGARTEFALFFVAYLSFLAYVSKTTLKNIVLMILLLEVGSLVLIINLDTLLAVLPKNRMLQLLDISSATSWQSRANFTSVAIETISKNPLLGDYGSYTNIGGVGSYSHNLLSAWVNLGMIGFGLYILAILVVAAGLIKTSLRKKAKTTEERVVFVFSIFTILALVAAKGYTYMLFGLMIGFYSRYASASKVRYYKMESK